MFSIERYEYFLNFSHWHPARCILDEMEFNSADLYHILVYRKLVY